MSDYRLGPKGVSAVGGLGRFDRLPGDLQLRIWDIAHDILQRSGAATLIQAIFRRHRRFFLREARFFNPRR